MLGCSRWDAGMLGFGRMLKREGGKADTRKWRDDGLARGELKV